MTSETLTAEDVTIPQEGSYIKRVILSCMVGNALEWYDFALYGYFATTIGSLFFPKFSTVASLLATFGIFAAGFIMRPLGGAIFGHIGDKIGRKNALLWSIYLMAIPTTLICLLPTYEQIGWLAPLLLTFIRLAQGLSMGGEFTGSMVFVVENAQQGNRGLDGSWVVFSLLIGILVGSAVATTTCYLLSEDSLMSWGWRIPFLMSMVGGFIESIMRHTLREPEEFTQAKIHHKELAAPVKKSFKHHAKTIAYVVTIELALAISFYLIVTFINNFLTAFLEMDKVTSLRMTSISMIAMGIAILFGGWLSDKIGRKAVLIPSGLGFAFFSYPLFLGLESSFEGALLAQIALSLIMGVFFAPFIATSLIHLTNNNAAPALYLSVASVISVIALFFMKDGYREKIEEASS
ncbi:MAG: MFS transporter [Alphaproteobacteria bacterium]|nr:MFS transporter [Alphaproteobacteria bacterium]